MTLDQLIAVLVSMLGYNPFPAALSSSGASAEQFLQSLLSMVDDYAKPMIQYLIDVLT